ncbi:hypothetical protein [Propioniferax innocua]|uniref:Uncharacterized protein n=1 Tax=Propioniferax innocua TaxID=1753 RepID=A0A542ZAG4_9ACTN|nr:hypothetical protein [Propioniferax innocua]TQL57316.1 hypothetical protein FB460_2393 [Propioniferax innocua]
MALNEAEKNDFIDKYTKVLVGSWSDEEFKSRLENEPRAVLAEVGLEIPADADLKIIATDPQSGEKDENGNHVGHLDRQIALWEVGLSTGLYQLFIPETPMVNMEDLDLEQLEAVAAGGDIYCCCCPCCCCA